MRWEWEKQEQKETAPEEENERLASTVNRTRGPSMATMDFTTKPPMRDCC